LYWIKNAEDIRPTAHAEVKEPGSWNLLEIEVRGRHFKASVNGKLVVDCTMDQGALLPDGSIPALGRVKGRIGIQKHTRTIRYRNIEIAELSDAQSTTVEPPRSSATAEPPRESVQTSPHGSTTDKPRLPPKKVASDLAQAGTVWVDDAGDRSLEIVTRSGESFQGKFITRSGKLERNVAGTIKDGNISWLARDVQAVKGGAGGDKHATIDGDAIHFPQQGRSSGAFTLKLISSSKGGGE
jgi:hypothetical protein